MMQLDLFMKKYFTLIKAKAKTYNGFNSVFKI